MDKHLRYAITRWDNAIIEAICASVILVSAILTAIYFGFGNGWIVTLQAVVYAFAVDGMFYVCVRLSRHFFAQGWGRVPAGLFWLLLAGAAGAFTYHNNLLFAANSWHLDPLALARAGVSDSQELQMHAIIPVAVVVIGAIIPRPRREKSPEQIQHEAAQQLALIQAKNAVRAAKASAAGAGVRGVVGGFFGQALNLEEKHQEQEMRHQARKAREEERQMMRALADEALLSECLDEDGLLDYALLEARLREAGKWPPAIARLQENAQENVQEESDPNMDAITSSGMPKWLTAEQVAETLGISVFQATQRMKPDYKGRYSRIKSREFSVHGKPVRKAYYKTVEALLPKETVQPAAQEIIQADAQLVE